MRGAFLSSPYRLPHNFWALHPLFCAITNCGLFCWSSLWQVINPKSPSFNIFQYKAPMLYGLQRTLLGSQWTLPLLRAVRSFKVCCSSLNHLVYLCPSSLASYFYADLSDAQAMTLNALDSVSTTCVACTT